MKKIDQRKWNSSDTAKKKQAAGKKSMGPSAFQKKYKSTRDPGLQDRIDLVVAMAEKAERAAASGQDVIRHNRAPLLFSHSRAVKLG